MNSTRLLKVLTKALFAFVFVFAFAATTSSAQVYVSSTSGNNSFDGTSPNVQSGLVGPKATILAGMTAAPAGGTVVIEAGTYVEDIIFTKDLTIQTTASGANTTITVGTGAFPAILFGNAAGVDVILAGGGAVITTSGSGVDYNMGTVSLASGSLAIPAGAAIEVTDATITGTAPTFGGGHAVTYNGTTAAPRQAGVEMPASTGGSTLTISKTGAGGLTFPAGVTAGAISHTGASSVTFQGAVSASGLVSTTGTGNMSFDGTLTSTFATNPSVSVVDGVFSAANVTLDDLGGFFVTAGESATVTGTLNIGVDADNGALTPIDNNGTLSVGSLVFTITDDSPTAILVNDVNPITIDSDGDLTIGSFTQAATTPNTTVGAGAGTTISAPVSFSNDTAGSRLTFNGPAVFDGTLTNSVATPDGTHFNGGATIGGLVTNTGTITIPGAQLVTLSGAVVHTLADVNGTGTLAISGGGDIDAAGLDADGNVIVNASAGTTDNAGTTVVDGTLTINDGGVYTGTVNAGNLFVTADAADFLATVSVSGSATLDDATVAGDGPDFGGNLQVTGTLTVSGDSDVAGTLVAGNVVVNDDLNLTSAGAGVASNITGMLTLNNAATMDLTAHAGVVNNTADGHTLTVKTTVIAPGATFTLGAENRFRSQGDFTGGVFVGTGADAELRFDIPSGGSTFSPGPNTVVYNFRADGNERTLVLAQSFAVSNDFFVDNDATFDLTNKLVRMTAAGNGTGLVRIATDAMITATGNTGAISFEGPAGAGIFTISSDVPGQPIGTLTNLVIAMTAPGTATSVTVTEDVTMTGVVNLVEGGLTVQALDTMTFSGDLAGISVNVAGTATSITGTTAGIYDLTYTGAGAAVAGPEFVDPGTNVIDDLTISTIGGATTLGPAVGINGNFTVGSTSVADVTGGLTIGGNVTINAVAASDGMVTGAGGLVLIGVDKVHTINGDVDTPVQFSANSTVVGNTSNDVESSLTNVTVDAGVTVSITNLQEIIGDLLVSGNLTLALSDADGVGVDDQDIEGDVLVEEGGTLTLGSNVAVNTGAAAATGTMIGNGGAGFASLNLAGFTMTTGVAGAAGAFAADADANLGTTGTIRVAHATSIGTDATASGTARAMAPTVNMDVAGITLSSDLGVAGTLDMDEDFTIGTFDIWLSGDATFTSAAAPAAIIGSTGQLIATGTTLTMSQSVTVPNFTLNTSGTASLASSDGTSYTFTVLDDGVGVGEFQSDAGTLDIGANTIFELQSTDGASESLFDFNAGTISGGPFVVNDDDDGNGGADFDFAGTGGTLTLATLTVNIGGAAAADANDGLDIGNSDVLTIGSGINLTGGTIFTNDGTTDASFILNDGIRIVRNLGVFEQLPTFVGNMIDVEYDGAVTTALELPGTVDELQLDAAVAFASGKKVTATTVDLNATLTLDNGAGATETLTVAAGGTVEVSLTVPVAVSGVADFIYAGAFNILYDAAQAAAITADAIVWSGSPAMVTIANGSTAGVLGGQVVTLAGNKSAVNVTVGDDDGLALGGNTLSVTGNIGGGSAITGGTVAFTGTLAQTVAGPVTLPGVTINNNAGVTLSGGNMTVTTVLNLINGTLDTGSNRVILPHTGTAGQGFTRTNGYVKGNVRKQIVGGAAPMPADRMVFPVGINPYRPLSITFNDPSQVSGAGASGIFIDVTHVGSAPGGNNNMPLTTVDDQGSPLTIARYPDFYWQVTSTSTLSPSVSYDIELNAEGYNEFLGEDIERTRTIRRQGGATTNFWTLAGGGNAANNDNFANSATNPVAVVRNAVGALNSGNGVFFTLGLESNMTVVNPAAVTVNAGATSVVDLTTVFGGGSGTYTYTVVSASSAISTGSTVGTNLNVAGVAAGATTLTVVATDGLNDQRSATVSVTVNPAFNASGNMAAVALNAGGTKTVDLTSIFSGGASPVTYVVTSSDGAVATGAVVGNTLTITSITAGSATITVTATDATAQTATSTAAVTVNAAMTVTNPAVITLTEGGTSAVTLSTVFAGGNGTYTYVATSAASANVTGTIASGVLTVTAVDAYAAGTTIGTTAVTVVATDGLGSSVTSTVTVDVLPKLGDLDGSGAPSAASASIALDYFLGYATLTAKQIVAADFNMDGIVNAYDAALIFNAFLNGKDELVANVASTLAFGTVQHTEGVVNIPVQFTGDLNDVVSMSFEASIDPAKAKVVGVTSNMTDGWIVKHTISEDGQLRIAAAGLGNIPADGTIATIAIQLNDAKAGFDLVAQGAVNNNSVSSLDAIEVVELPDTFTLQGNYPNPFNPSTTISFDLPATADVEVQVVDMVGRVVMTLPAQNIQAGAKRSIHVNASQLASGSYFYRVIARMDSKTLVQTGRMLLVK